MSSLIFFALFAKNGSIRKCIRFIFAGLRIVARHPFNKQISFPFAKTATKNDQQYNNNI